MSISSFALQGNFNVKNAMASNTLSDLMRVRKETIRNCMADFENEEHKLENVLTINGSQYINDSKANNVNASYYALDSVENTTIWIAGGIDEANDYDILLPLVNEKVSAIICLGENNDKLIETFGNVVDFMIETTCIRDAVKIAYKLSREGETVLFSPAGQCEKQEDSYIDRGNRFKEAVRQL
ncbi:glutamate ligase domain-containing protein [Lutimonas sp.]|uniref:glutamate ligase domain-containing protein n=1 Tax=Lutimonas sp. TaxID=1872403 RepID=UPI003D9B1BDF